MPKHQFGIMRIAPVRGRRFDKYEPEKFNCISIDDAYILPLMEHLSEMQFYWHTLDVTGNGLAYCGITLISPKSAEAMLNLTANKCELTELSALLTEAIERNCFVIHFGI